MVSFRYKEYSADKFEIVGKDEFLVALVAKGADNLWRIIPQPKWVLGEGFNLGPFPTPEAAFEELGAVVADQS